MKFIVLTCLLALAAASNNEEKLDALDANVEVAADQDAAEWKLRHYYGHYSNSYRSYHPYGYKHWRGRRSAEESNPEHIEADLEANQSYRHGYYDHYNPYGYRNYHSRFGNRRGHRW